MGRLAVILGSNALGPGGEEIAAAAAEHGAAIVQRHGAGDGTYVLPHEIDHAANLRPLAEQGCDRVLAIGSVGSLRPELPVGSLALPRRLHRPPPRRLDPRRRPRPLGARLRPALAAPKWSRPGAAGGQALRDGGVYWQAIGPRFETPAEIRLIAAHADVVGMTIAAECIVAGELGLAYAAVCVVDNLANGARRGRARRRRARGRPRGQRDAPARRPGGGAAAARSGRPVSAAVPPHA